MGSICLYPTPSDLQFFFSLLKPEGFVIHIGVAPSNFYILRETNSSGIEQGVALDSGLVLLRSSVFGNVLHIAWFR